MYAFVDLLHTYKTFFNSRPWKTQSHWQVRKNYWGCDICALLGVRQRRMAVPYQYSRVRH